MTQRESLKADTQRVCCTLGFRHTGLGTPREREGEREGEGGRERGRGKKEGGRLREDLYAREHHVRNNTWSTATNMIVLVPLI